MGSEVSNIEDFPLSQPHLTVHSKAVPSFSHTVCFYDSVLKDNGRNGCDGLNAFLSKTGNQRLTKR